MTAKALFSCRTSAKSFPVVSYRIQRETSATSRSRGFTGNLHSSKRSAILQCSKVNVVHASSSTFAAGPALVRTHSPEILLGKSLAVPILLRDMFLHLQR